MDLAHNLFGAPMPDNSRHVVLAFWRRDPEGDVEFFIPLDHDYLARMRFMVVDERAADTARRLARFQFEVAPRANVRIFRVDGTSVAAFNLSVIEAGEITVPGAWLPASLIANTTVATLLQDVAMRL